MRNARTGFVTPFLAAVTLAIGPALMAVQADDQGSKDTLDMNTKMQQKLNSKLGGNIGNGGLDIESKLSDRVDRKNAENNSRLDSQSESFTSADRGNKGGEDDKSEKKLDREEATEQ